MAQIPRETGLDKTLSLLSDGYRFIGKRCEHYQTNWFETRVMLQKVICVRGEEAAKMFYQPDRFTRQGAIPPTTLKLLQDKGSVATLDAEAHHHRKRMFMSMMSAERTAQLTDLVEQQWLKALQRWQRMDTVVLHGAVQEILTLAVCEWAGIPVGESEAKQRTAEFAAMIDGAGSVGLKNWKGMLLRARTERWAQRQIKAVRAGELDAPAESAVQIIANHRGLENELLDEKTAAVELLNVLRPTVAVARFIVFAALALHQYPQCLRKLQSGVDQYLEWFVQEVRRFYPFFPLVGGHVREDFEWQGHRFSKGDWVLLDLYGTDHDAATWQAPDSFNPERFRSWNGSAFNLIPQGGGDFVHNHCCAGEWLTVALMKRATRLLTSAMRYDVPEQDLSIDFSRLPTLPQSGFMISNVKAV